MVLNDCNHKNTIAAINCDIEPSRQLIDADNGSISDLIHMFKRHQ